MAAVCKINCTKLGKVNHVYRVVNQRNVKTHTRVLSRRAERRTASSDGSRVVWNYSYVTEMASGQNATWVKLVSRTLQNSLPCYARVKIPPFLPITATRLRSLAIRPKQFYGPYRDSLASRSASYIIW